MVSTVMIALLGIEVGLEILFGLMLANVSPTWHQKCWSLFMGIN